MHVRREGPVPRRRVAVLAAIAAALAYGLMGRAEMDDRIDAAQHWKEIELAYPLDCDATVIQSLPSGRQPTYACYVRIHR